jgi:capsular polysaccharide biosynthesis protein
MQDNNAMDEISLRELIEILLKRKKEIAIITIIAILAAGFLSFVVMKPTYEAKMILMASGMTDQVNKDIDTGNVESVLNVMTKYPSMNIETYRQQITAPAVLSKTITDLNLEEEYTVESLASKITLETIQDTQLIAIKNISTDPEKSTNIVNTVGNNFIEFVTQNVKDRATVSSAYLKTQMEVEKQLYDAALLEQKNILSQPRGATEVNQELSAKFKQITDFKVQLNEIEVRKAGLESAIEESNNNNSKGSVTARPSLGGNFNLSFDDSTKILKVELAESEGTILSIESKIEEMQADIEKLQIESQDKVHKERLITQKVEIAQKTYEAFVSKYEELRVTESSRVGEASITVISKAYEPQRPIGPRRMLNLAIATVLGLMVGVFYAFFKEYWISSAVKQ